MTPEEKQERWCREFARLYAARSKCDPKSAAEIAAVIHSVPGLMQVKGACEVLMSDETLKAVFSKGFPSSGG